MLICTGRCPAFSLAGGHSYPSCLSREDGSPAAACNAGQEHEKGGVEGEAGQFCRNYLVLVPVPQVRNLKELNLLLEVGAREDDQRVIAGRDQAIGVAMLSERAHLLPLIEEGFDLASVHFPTVNASGVW
jgi:hypothetical protein